MKPGDDIPATRWELGGAGSGGYTERFLGLIAEGADIEGEARLADALVPRAARILDAGSGMGRIGAALQRRGHRVVGVEKDPELVQLSRRQYPELAVVESDILALSPTLLEEADAPAAYDLIVLVGNVIVLAAPDTEARLLRTLVALLAPGGRILVGFHPVDGPAHVEEDYPFEAFARDVDAAGLRVEARFGSYELRPADESYVVAVLSPPSR